MIHRAILFGWIAIVLLVSVPWTSYRLHAHWDSVVWVPFRSGVVNPVDVASNIVLYVPLGWWWAHVVRPGQIGRVVYAALSAFFLSSVCEWSQVYSHGRFPSATDVAANTAGAVAGAVITISCVHRLGRSPVP
jgi:VanZ family protein